MNRNINDFIYHSLTALLFVAAVSLFFYVHFLLFNHSNHFEQLYDREVVFGERELMTTKVIYKGDIVAKLSQKCDCEIVVDGVVFTENSDFSLIDDKDYTVNEEIDEQGKVIRLNYWGF